MTITAKPYLKSISIESSAPIDDLEYPFSIPAIRALTKLEFHPDVTFLVGENGSGKSTILEAIALALGFGSEGGTKNMRVETVATVSSLHKHLGLEKSFKRPKDSYFLRAESFFNVATYTDEVGYLGGYGDKSLHARSHGESFLVLLTDKLRGKGLYLLDEPEAALSPSRQLAALTAIDHLVEDESQFIIATHSPILLSYPKAKIFFLDSNGVREVSYEETEHYSVTKDFLNNYKGRIKALLAEEGDA